MAEIVLTFPGAPGGPLAPTSPWGKRQCVHTVCILITLNQLIQQEDECNSYTMTTRIHHFSFGHELYMINLAHESCFMYLYYLISLFTFWPSWSILPSFTLRKWNQINMKHISIHHRWHIHTGFFSGSVIKRHLGTPSSPSSSPRTLPSQSRKRKFHDSLFLPEIIPVFLFHNNVKLAL